jgi:hypothetical protein
MLKKFFLEVKLLENKILKYSQLLEFDILATMIMKMSTFWDITPYSPL